MKSPEGLVRTFNVTALLCAIYLMYQVITHAHPQSMHFQMTWLVYTYLLSAVIIALVFIPLRRIGLRNRTAFWLAIFMFFSLLAAIGGAFRAASADQHTYMFWFYFFEPAYLLIEPIFLVLVLTYIDRQDLLYRPLTWLAIFGTTFFMLPIAGSTHLLSDPSLAHHYSFGYTDNPPGGPAIAALAIWSLVLSLVALLLLVGHYRQVKTIPSRRRQAQLFLLATLIPMVVGYVWDGVLPMFHIQLPINPLLALTQISLLTYAIYRYRLLSIDPTALADTILETVHESVITINANHEIEYLNDAARRLFRVRPNKVRGRTIDKMFDAVTAAVVLSQLEADVIDEDTVEMEAEIANQKLPISLSMSQITLKGNVEGYILVVRDISKEHAIKRDIERQVTHRTSELNHEHARLQSAIDSLDVGLLMTFRDREAVSCNAMLPKILGFPAHASKQLTLRVIKDHLQTSKFDLIEAIKRCQQSGQPFEVKDVTYGKQVLRVSGAPIQLANGMTIGTIVLVDDITEATVMERSKDEFFSIASHELRTPLTAIKGNTSLILDYYRDLLKDQALKEMLTDVHDSSTRLITIVNDFLDVSRLEQSKMSFQYEPVALETVIESVTYEMKAVVREKNVYLKIDKPTLDRLPKVWADKNRLKQVVYNLIGNALKFTDQGGITLTAEMDDKMVRVSVIDTGRGMTEDSQKLLFHKFQQASSSLLTRDTTRGTGLGLYISKMIIENMGGVISLVSSKEGVGTTFAFTIPVVTKKQLAEGAQQSPTIHTDSQTGLTVRKET